MTGNDERSTTALSNHSRDGVISLSLIEEVLHMRKISMIGVVLVMWLFMAKGTETSRAAEYGDWQVIGPGGGGQITSISEDPSDPDRLFITINTGGARKSTDGGKTWQIINRGFDYRTLGKFAFKMMDIAVHPAHGHVLLVAGLNGDIYESSDGGQEWRLSYRHPSGESELLLYHFSRFTFDPENPDVVYIGVGSIQRLILGVDARRTGEHWPKIDVGPTILRGVWSGSTWDWHGVGSIEGRSRGCDEEGCGQYLNIYSIGICPDQTDTFFFVTERGLYRGQIDGSGTIASFEKIRKGLPKPKYAHGGQILFDRHNPGVAYLTLCNLKNKKIQTPDDERVAVGGVFKSVDCGARWSKLEDGLENNSNYFDIQIDPENPETVYVAQFFMKAKGEWIGGNLYRSGDSGGDWVKLVKRTRSNIDPGWQQEDVDKKKRFGAHFVCVSNQNVARFNKGGLLVETNDLSSRYPEWRNILTKKVGTDEQWTTTGSEAIALAHSVAIGPKDSDTVYLPYGDSYYFKSTNGGESLGVLVGVADIKDVGNAYDSGTLIIDEEDSDKIYAATQGPHQQLLDGGVMYSADGGESWATIGWHLKDYLKEDRLKRGAKTDLLIEQLGEKRRNIYVANYGNESSCAESQGGVYLLEDFDGETDPDSIDYWNANWQRIFPVEEGESMPGTCTIAVRDGFRTLYVGVNNTETNDYGLYKLIKTAGAWHSEGQILSDEPDSWFNESDAFNDMEVGLESQDIYIATDKGLFVLDENDDIAELSVFQFETLRDEGIDPDVAAIEIHPEREDIIYVASPQTEILRSDDRGLQWEAISGDIPTLGFIVLKVDPNRDVIYAEVPAAGIWKRSFESSD